MPSTFSRFVRNGSWLAFAFAISSLSAIALGQQPTPPEKQNPAHDPSSWLWIRPTDSNAEFQMPGKPRRVERQLTPVPDQPPVTLREYQGVFRNGKTLLVFGYLDLPDAPAPSRIPQILDNVVKGACAGVSGKILKTKKIKQDGLQGLKSTFIYAYDLEVYQVQHQVFISDRRQYQLFAIMKRDGFDDAFAQRFLASFRKARSDLPPRPPANLWPRPQNESFGP